MTGTGQRLGLIRFTVSDNSQQASLASGEIRPSGLSALNLRRFVPGRSNDSEARPDD